MTVVARTSRRKARATRGHNAVEQTRQHAGAVAQYKNALRTTSPMTMMIMAITRVRKHLRDAAQYHREGQYDLEMEEKMAAKGKLRGLRAVIAPQEAPELSRDLRNFYSRMLDVLSARWRKHPIEERYQFVDRHLEALAREWNRVASQGPDRPEPIKGSASAYVDQVL